MVDVFPTNYTMVPREHQKMILSLGHIGCRPRPSQVGPLSGWGTLPHTDTEWLNEL